MIVMLVLGLGSIPLSDLFTDDHAATINIVEWNFSLLTTGYYLLTWRAWRLTGFREFWGQFT